MAWEVGQLVGRIHLERRKDALCDNNKAKEGVKLDMAVARRRIIDWSEFGHVNLDRTQAWVFSSSHLGRDS